MTMFMKLHSFYVIGFCLLFFLFDNTQIFAQDYDSLLRIEEKLLKDSLKLLKERRKDSLQIVRKAKKIRRPVSAPLRASLLSAALPGAGQLYNRKLWWLKIPIFYGALGFAGYNLYTNQKSYISFRDNYLYSRDNNPLTVVDDKYASFNADQLKTQRDGALRERDFSILLFILVYGLNIAEAAATAHLTKFDVSDDLTMQVKPKFFSTTSFRSSQDLTAGLAITFHFK
jgi:hypothetical protein